MPIWKYSGISATDTALEDASLDLAAFHQAIEDVAAWLQAHDGMTVEDLLAEFAAWHQTTEDVGMNVGAFLLDIQNLSAVLEAASDYYGDLLPTFLQASVLVLEDWGGWFSAVAEAREDLATWMEAAKWAYSDCIMSLETSDGSVRIDLGTYLEAIEGLILGDCGTWLCAIKQPPAFRSVVAQRLASVTEVALGIVVDESGNPVTTITGETVTIS